MYLRLYQFSMSNVFWIISSLWSVQCIQDYIDLQSVQCILDYIRLYCLVYSRLY